MAKFVIEFDSSRKNNNNELLPFSQFVPGVLSLKNTKKVYKLFVGETNKNSLSDSISSFKSNIKIYREILGINPNLPLEILNNNSSEPIPVKDEFLIPPPKRNVFTGRPAPFIFKGVDIKNIPFIDHKILDKMKRQEMIKLQEIRLPRNLPSMRGSLLDKIKLG